MGDRAGALRYRAILMILKKIHCLPVLCDGSEIASAKEPRTPAALAIAPQKPPLARILT